MPIIASYSVEYSITIRQSANQIATFTGPTEEDVLKSLLTRKLELTANAAFVGEAILGESLSRNLEVDKSVCIITEVCCIVRVQLLFRIGQVEVLDVAFE